MEDIAKNELTVKKIADFIDERKGSDTLAINISEQSSFTDYFIITTINSWAHLKGLFRELRGFLRECGLQSLHHQKIQREDTWVLIDCGSLVIHLMDEEMRNFYELEKLWYTGKTVYHSSKSSKSSPSS
jgi:ribosome-associated protein